MGRIPHENRIAFMCNTLVHIKPKGTTIWEIRTPISKMAKNAKDDESYTAYETIEKEMVHYLEHFEGKTVLCNCDIPFSLTFVNSSCEISIF